MEFSEKLAALRRRQGLSQEQLADRLGVTRQSVSKWEGGAAMPELSKLVALSELFGVSVDYLVKDYLDQPEGGGEDPARADRLERKVDALSRDYRRSFGPVFRYTSRTRILGLPLVSVRFGHDRHPTRDNTAVGVVAMGNFSVGIISVGLISVGVVAVGMIALGLLALGAVAVGAAALGVSAVGIAAAGVSAVGWKAAVGLTANAAAAAEAGPHILP